MGEKLELTPGPWGWFGNAKGNLIYLATHHGGRRFVMQFKRWGMSNAQPVFQADWVMKPAAEFLKFEVGDREVTGYEAAKDDPSVYRFDIIDIDHPDARAIRLAPDLLATLKKFRAILCPIHPDSDAGIACKEADDLIAEIEGGAS